jgi:hypothetical protein
VAAADDRFAQISGDDAVADLLVGRIPVATRAGLSAVVRTILTLENRPPGAWKNTAYFSGGYEQSVTLGQNGLQSLAASADRTPARLD